MKLGKFGKVRVLLFAAGVAAEMALLYYSERKLTPRQRSRIRSQKIVNRPNRAGHFVGNLVRVVRRRLSY
jgi:hypothetical protein